MARLKPSYFYGKSDELVKYYEELEDFLLEDIATFLIKSAEIGGKADREIFVLQQMGLSEDEIVKRLSKLSHKSQSAVRKILKDSAMTSFSNDKEVLDKYFKGDYGSLDNPTIKKVLEAEWIKTNGELDNLTRTTIKQYRKDLIRLLNEAEIRVSSGMQSYSQAVCDILTAYATKGLVIDYPTGARKSLESAVRCCVVTSMNQTAAQVTNSYIAEGGIEYVLTTAHLGARHDDKHPNSLESHDWWQGRVFKIIGSEDGIPNLLKSTGYDIDPITGEGTVVNPLGLHGYNCRHSHQPWDKDMPNPWMNEDGTPKIDPLESRELYDRQQTQRGMERNIRATKRKLNMLQTEMDNLPKDSDEYIKAQQKYDETAYKLRLKNEAYNTFCSENDLQTQRDRLAVVGFGKAESSKASGRAKNFKNNLNHKEESLRTKKSSERSYGVNWNVVKSKEYTKRFESISSNPKANRLVAKISRNILANRDGKNTEEIHVVSLTKAVEVAKIDDQNISFGINRTERFENDIKRAENKNEELLCIHNHPRGLPPSVSDLNELIKDKNTSGITIGHNGNIYYYTRPNKEITTRDLTVARMKIKSYNSNKDRDIMIIEILAKAFDFEFKEL